MISLKEFIDADINEIYINEICINEIYINESSCNAKKNKTSVEDADEKERIKIIYIFL